MRDQLEERVATHRGELAVEHLVDGDHRLVLGGVRIEERPAQRGQLVFRTATGGEAGDRYLHELAYLEQLQRADGGTGVQQRDTRLDRFRDLVGPGVHDEATAGDASRCDDEVLAREESERLPYCAAADATATAQLRLGRKPVAGAQAPRRDLGSQIVREDLVSRRSRV